MADRIHIQAASLEPAQSQDGVERRSVTRFQTGPASSAGQRAQDSVALEEPLELRLAFGEEGRRQEASVSITMRTPGADVQLALGFLFGEGMIQGADDVASAAPCGPPVDGKTIHNVVRVELAAHVNVDPERLLRHFYTTSSCGVCGKASLDALRQQPQIAAPDANFVVSATALRQLPVRLAKRQAAFAQTGGLHCAGLFDSVGELSGSFEDVGRHNALDKLVGASVLSGNLPWSSHGIMLSGRASFELLQKAMMAGAPLVAAIGAPSSLAIDLAEEFGITLVGFLRDDGFNVYCHPQRVQG
jgi:FdhD protein